MFPDNIAATGSTAVVAAILMQYLKNSGWATWFTKETQRANFALSVLVAFATSLGIHWTWSAATDSLVITGLYGALTHGLWQSFLQWAAQHAAYKSLIVPSETLGDLRGLLQQLVDAQRTNPVNGGHP